jgi:hypothetical protein
MDKVTINDSSNVFNINNTFITVPDKKWIKKRPTRGAGLFMLRFYRGKIGPYTVARYKIGVFEGY